MSAATTPEPHEPELRHCPAPHCEVAVHCCVVIGAPVESTSGAPYTVFSFRSKCVEMVVVFVEPSTLRYSSYIGGKMRFRVGYCARCASVLVC